MGGAIIKSSKGHYINFCANSVCKLTEYNKLGYNDVIFMMNCLNNQNIFLSKKFNCGMYYLDLNDIIVVDSSIFININPQSSKNITSEFYTFNSPFSRNSKSSFFSPEILALDKIPATITCKCFQYSLGALAIYFLFGKNARGLDDIDIKKILTPILQTKLYWTLLRAINADYKKRNLLLV
jgi:hypothetical protein